MSQIAKEDYLKKYLSAGKEKKKKRTKEHKGKGTRVVDDDAPLPAPGDTDGARAELMLAPVDERPQVAGNWAQEGSGDCWKALEECDLEELESQRRLLSASLRQLERDPDPAGKAKAPRRRHDSCDDGQAEPARSRPRPVEAPDSDCSPPRRKDDADRVDSDESPPRSWKPQRTLDGRRAGLQDLATLRAENKAAKQRDKHSIDAMSKASSGRDAETKLRGRKLEKARQRAEEEEKARQRKKVYDVWNRGVKQVQQQKAELADRLHEMNKPLARHADDRDLELELKSRTRADDPMAEYMARKHAKHTSKSRPRYDKSDPPANRYGIWPGYRWDGVDRSNGFERQLVARKNAKIARDAEAYKWSTEDM